MRGKKVCLGPHLDCGHAGKAHIGDAFIPIISLVVACIAGLAELSWVVCLYILHGASPEERRKSPGISWLAFS